ncbi:MAG: hypothetical protein IJ419_11070 [Agathobacter sp.]|nr:hypothetical protein [Agathobacter sp.]
MAQTQTPATQKQDAARQRRVQDETYTRAVEAFLDTVYYNTASPYDKSKRLSDHLSRNEYDAEAQKKGADIFLERSPTETIIVDEKFAINYREKDLRTFSFELESRARGGDSWVERPGWFINPENQTTHYMLLWFKSDHDISTMYDYEACLVSKQAIKDQLAREGVDVHEMFRAFKDCVEHQIEPPAGCKISFGQDKITMDFNGYRITQSTQFEEAPINIIIPREKLREMAELQMQSKTPIRIQDAIDAMERDKHPNLSKCVSPKVAELLNTRNLITGSLSYEQNGRAFQGVFKGTPTHGDRLLVTVDGRQVPIAQNYKGHWFSLTDKPIVDTIFKKNVHPFNEMLAQQLQEKTGISISAMDSMHQPLPEVPQENIDGMIIKVTNPLTNQVEGRFQYHEAINRFVALGNSPLSEKAQIIGDVSIISETEYMKIRAFADRVADWSRDKDNRYRGKTEQEALQYAKRIVEAVTSPDWQSTRATTMEAIAQGLSKTERNEIIAAITHDGCINALAEKLMRREKVCGTADLFIACTQEENYKFPVREQVPIKKPEPVRNQKINTFDLARQVGCQIDEKPGYNGRTSFMINWTPETVAAACAVIREQNNQTNTQFIFEGYAPTWAMAAFMHECEPNKTFISNKLTGVLDMQGITYGHSGPVQAEAENVARISTIRCESMVEGIIYPAQIQLPEIEPGQIVFIQGDLPYYAQVAIGEKYGEMAAAVYFEQKNGDFTCGISNHELFTVGDQLSNAKREQVVGQLLQEIVGQEIVEQENGEGQEVEDPDLLPV